MNCCFAFSLNLSKLQDALFRKKVLQLLQAARLLEWELLNYLRFQHWIIVAKNFMKAELAINSTVRHPNLVTTFQVVLIVHGKQNKIIKYCILSFIYNI